MKPNKPLGQYEFIALIAMLFATVAFSIDAMLPALSTIGATLSPAEPERASLVVGAFVMGLGVGTFFAGPLSDTFGRRPVIIWAIFGYVVGAFIAGTAQSIELMLAGRVLQGLSAAGPRIASMALVRDLYSGDKMASIMSFSMAVFGLVPAVAPLVGQTVMQFFGWRAIFFAISGFGICIMLWVWARQPETLAPDARKPLRFMPVFMAMKQAMANRVFRLSVLALTLLYTGLFAIISSVQPIFDLTYDRAVSFPILFGALSLISLLGSILNGRIVGRFGMRKIIKTMLIIETAISGIVLLWAITATLPFVVFYLWLLTFLVGIGFTFGNLNALAMEPMGDIAGTAASLSGGISAVVSAVASVPITLAFDLTATPLIIGVTMCFIATLATILWLGPRQA